MDNRPSEDLLHATHEFPGSYQIKAIGDAADDFTGRVLAAVAEELPSPAEVVHTVRLTRGGRHVALTLQVNVQNAEQVRAIYSRIHEVKGLTFLF